MNRSQLASIAQSMRAEFPRIGYAERLIDHTYLALMSRAPGRLMLIIGRHDTFPPLETADAIASAFGVAADTPGRTTTTRLPSQDGHCIPLHAMTYQWAEDLVPAQA